MLFIITLHTLGHGGILGEVDSNSLRGVILWWMEGIAYAAVNIYVLISGYFMVDNEFKLRKLFSLLAEVIFYSVIIYIVTSYKTFSVMDFVKSCFPTITSAYWFISTYVVMYCLSPFLNILIRNMNKKMHEVCILILLLFFCIWDKGSSVAWFICLYIVAAYIKYYYQPGNFKRRNLLLCYFGVSICIPLSRYCISYVTKLILGQEFKTDYFYRNDTLLVFFASVLLLLIFLTINIEKKWINKLILRVSPLTLGVYLIHDNSNVREKLWQALAFDSNCSNVIFFAYVITIILGIFVVCCVIEWMRQMLFHILKIDMLVEKIAGFLTSHYKSK